jgi:hypothetical protein
MKLILLLKKHRLIVFLASFLLSIFTIPNGYAQQETIIVKNYLKDNLVKESLSVQDIDDMVVSDAYLSPTTGLYHLYFKQTYKNIEVYNGILNGTIKNGVVVNIGNSFVKNLGSMIPENAQILADISSGKTGINPKEALKIASNNVNLISSEPSQIQTIKSTSLNTGLINQSIFKDNLLSNEDISVKLYWFFYNDSSSNKPYPKVALTYEVGFLTKNSQNYWSTQIDATTGKVLFVYDNVLHCDFGKPNHKHNCETHSKPNQLQENTAAFAPNSYNVFDYPLEAPTFGARTIVTSPYTRFAPTGTGPGTTNGWHNDGTTNYTITRGNNVWAKDDIANDNEFTIGSSPNSATLDFNYPYTQGIGTSASNLNAAITNLFYWNNLLHNVLWRYGFDEPSGNFQNNNINRGGAGNDYVNADAQDGSGTNNANFFTPPDGFNPRMQMYIWNDGGNPAFTPDSDFDNGVIAHEYGHGWSIRLTGGPSVVNCLQNAEQAGEGWSDYAALMFTTDWSALTPSLASANIPRTIGTYVKAQNTNGPGIRPYPYSYDKTNVNNPVTYAGVSNTAVFSQPHGIGSIWATMLWDMTWEIILQDNFIAANIYDVPNLLADYKGNIAALKLVNEGLRLQACSPSFVQARDAIFQADILLFNGRYRCAIGKAFARRGLGNLASTGESTNDRIVTEDFTPFGENFLTAMAPTAGICSNSLFSFTANSSSGPGTNYAWSRPAIPGISNTANSGTGANINETLINTTNQPIVVNYFITLTPDACTSNPPAQKLSVTVNPLVMPTVGNFAICQNVTIPAGQGLVAPSSNTTSITGVLTTNDPTYRRGDGNNTTNYSQSNIGTSVFFKTYTFVANSTGPLTIETTGGTLNGDSPFDTYFSLYQSSFNPASPATNFLRGDDDSGALLFASRLTQNITAGTTYILVVSTYANGTIGSFTLQSNLPIFVNGTNQWYTSTVSPTPIATGEIFNPVGVPGSGVPNTSAVGNFTYFLASSLYPSCRKAVTFSIGVQNPSSVNVSSTAICSGTPITLSASCPVGSTLRWFNQPTGGSILGTGNNLAQSPAVNTTYYAECNNGACTSSRVATNTVLINPTNQSISGSISSGNTTVYASQTITATNTLNSPAKVGYKAGKSITLNNGFRANPGTVFLAEIGGCN